jgi:hypothetical protein
VPRRSKADFRGQQKIIFHVDSERSAFGVLSGTICRR